MTMDRATSRVFEAARQMKLRLVGQEWPASPSTGELPNVTLSQPLPDAWPSGEMIHVVPTFGDEAQIAWARFPVGRDESFSIEILIDVSSYDDEDLTIDRLEVLSDIAQRAFYDDLEPDPLLAVKPLGIAEAVLLEGIGQVAFTLGPMTDDGMRATARLTYRLAFRI